MAQTVFGQEVIKRRGVVVRGGGSSGASTVILTKEKLCYSINEEVVQAEVLKDFSDNTFKKITVLDTENGTYPLGPVDSSKYSDFVNEIDCFC